MNIPYDMSTKINNELEDEANNPEEMKKGITFLTEKAESTNDEIAKAKLFNLIAVYMRILKDYENALKVLNSMTFGMTLKKALIQIKLKDAPQ